MPHFATRSLQTLPRRAWPWLAAALSGGLLALCFPPYDQGWLVWIALTPLLCAVWFSGGRKRPHLRPALLGYVAGVVFFTLVFGWLSTLAGLFKSPALLGLPPLLSLILGLYFAFWAWFVAQLPGLGPRSPASGFPLFLSSRGNLRIGFLAACAWMMQEWVRGWLFSGFGWNGLGVALHADLPMIQIADLIGVLGLSGMVAFGNVMAVIIIRRILAEIGPQFLKRVRWEFSVAMALIAGVFAYGVHALLRPREADASELKVAMIQPNIPQDEKWDAESEAHVMEQLDVLTLTASISKPDLIIWPESSLPRGIFADELNYQFLLKEAQRGNYGLLLGTILPDLDAGGDYNAAALVTNGGRDPAHPIQLYRKIHLVPYGEYLPMRPILEPIAGSLVPGDFLKGEKADVLSLASPPVRLGVLICFEDTLGDLTAQFVAGGAQVLVNITNDGWFQKSAAAEQQFTNAIFRAVENRRPLLRCANTGITGSVDPYGRPDRWAQPFRQEVPLPRKIPVARNQPTTFFTLHPNGMGHFASAVVALWMAFGLIGWLPRRHPSLDALPVTNQ